MNENKPLKDWTLEELLDFCDSQKICDKCKLKKFCWGDFRNSPCSLDLKEQENDRT